MGASGMTPIVGGSASGQGIPTHAGTGGDHRSTRGYDRGMGWTFRRSVNLGPFRVNMSKSGVGYSVGAAGFRTGRSANGRKYSSFNIPGTGVSYRKSGAGSVPKGCTPMLVLAAGALGAAGAWAIWT